MLNNLFKKADLADFVEMPADLSEKRLDPHIREVERFRLRPILDRLGNLETAFGLRLAQIAEYAAALAAYESLLARGLAAGVAVPELLANALVDEALVAARALVANAALARYWPFAQSKLTKNGLVAKSIDQSEQVSSATLTRQVAVFQQTAQSYEGELVRYLSKHADALRAYLGESQTAAGCELEAARRGASPVAHLTIRRGPPRANGKPGPYDDNRPAAFSDIPVY